MQDEFMPLEISTKIGNPSKYIQNSMNFKLYAPALIRKHFGRIISLVDEMGRDIIQQV